MTKESKPCPVDMTVTVEDLENVEKLVSDYEHRTQTEPTHLIVGPGMLKGIGSLYGLHIVRASVTDPVITNDPDYWVGNESTKEKE